MLSLRLILWSTLALSASACDSTVDDIDGGGGGTGGAAGSGGSSSSSGPACVIEPGEPGEVLATLPQPAHPSCPDHNDFVEACSAAGGAISESCSSFGNFLTCSGVVAPGPGEFACSPTDACQLGQVCLHVTGQGDGCAREECRPVPAPCVDDPTCDCIEHQLVELSCDDSTGNVVVTGPGSITDP